MNREDIIRMAREAGWPEWDIVGCEIELERFAALVAAAEREACANEVKGYDGMLARLIMARGQG